MTRGALSLVLCLVTAAVKAQTPTCRLDDTLAADVRQSATLALRVFAGNATPRAVAVNAKEPVTAGTVQFEIVRDASCDGMSVVDEWTVAGGVCRATPSTRVVRCSANALAALTTLDRRANRASPALLYVIAHELAHLDQQQAGKFEGEVLLLDLAHSEQAKWRALRRVCAGPSDDRPLEDAADHAALTVLERAADLDRYRDPLLSPQAAVYTITDRLRLAARELAQWEAESSPATAARPTALTVQTFEPNQENVARTARRLLCQIRSGTKGLLALPNVPGSHPDEPTRLGAISARLRTKAKDLPAGRLGLPPEIPDVQPLENLIPITGDISATFDQKEKDFYAALWPHVCETWLNPQVWPDCNDPSPGDGTPACPLFLAIFDEERITPKAAELPHRIHNGTLEVEGRIHGMSDLRSPRGLLLAVDGPPALVRWTGKDMAADALPCSPAAIVATADGHTVLCAQPFGYVRVRDGRPFAFHRMTTARLNDSVLSAADVEGTSASWIGDRVTGSAYIAAEGFSIGFEIISEGARSLDAWRKAGCEQLRSGFALFETAETRQVLGITVSRLGTTEVARFGANAGELSSLVAPDHLQIEERGVGPTLACAAAPRGAICVDTNGQTFDPFGNGSPLPAPRIPFSDELRSSRVLNGSLAVQGDDTMVAVWNGNLLEVFRRACGAKDAMLVRREETAVVAADWYIGTTGAYLIASDHVRSRVIPLPARNATH